MGIFDRNYDRDFGHRGGSGYRGNDRGYGYRGGAYEGNRGRDHAFGASGYDRDLGSRDFGNTGYGNPGYGARSGNWQRGSLNRLEGDDRDVYDRDSGWHAGRGMGMGGAWNYDRDFDRGTPFGASNANAGYDRDFDRDRWQTDNGDPFGDRTSHTPIRVMRGEFRNDAERGRGMNYDRDFGRGHGAGSNVSYDRDMMGRGGMDREQDRGYMHGLNYDPYEDRNDLSTGRGGWGASGRHRGNERGWF